MLENTVNDSLSFHLLNDFQRNFPLCPAPFAELASTLGVAENTVLRGLAQLRRDGQIARVGAIFAPKRIGASTLVAMAVPSERLQAVTDVVTRFPEVNHNEAREHFYNLWFVVTAGSAERLQAALDAIAQAAGFPLLQLPLLRQYPADSVGAVDFSGEKNVEAAMSAETFFPPSVLDEIGRRLVMALQEGLPLFVRPFSVLASRLGCEESEVLERIRRWCSEGTIKRFGVIVRHHASGQDATKALLVHDIPDDQVGAVGMQLAKQSDVPLCYERSRVLPDWPYNLFCVIQAPTRDAVLTKVAALRQSLGLEGCAHAVLFSPSHGPR